MQLSRWIGLILAVLILAGLLSSAQAIPGGGGRLIKSRPSHILPDNLGDMDAAEKMLAHRLLMQKLLGNRALMKGLNAQQAEALKLLPGLLEKDPELSKLVQDALQNPNAENVKRLQDWVTGAQQALKAQGVEPGKQLDSPNPAGEGQANGAGALPPPAPSPARPRSDRPQKLRDFLSRLAIRAADGLETMDQSADSKALRDALRQIGRVDLVANGLQLNQVDSAELDALERLADALSLDKLDPSSWRWRGPRVRWAPELPGIQAPSSLSAPNWGSFSGPSLPSSGNTVLVLLWVAIVGMVGVLLWKYGPGLWPTEAAAVGPAWQIGDWPVAPEAVATRGDLVRAFEYLALSCLGREALPCHHHDLAQRLGHNGADRQQAAQALAGLYEQARYAPEQADAGVLLAQPDQAAARRALRLLAGDHRA
jgi:hypothetical protein